MSLPIGDYAVIGDTRTTALVSSQGSIDWLCWPRHDSPALFTRLLDERAGGSARVVFDEPMQATRRYVDGTNILQTTFQGVDGVATLTDFMPIAERLPLPDEGPDGDSSQALVRIVACVDRRVAGRFVFRFTPDFGRGVVEEVAIDDGASSIRFGDGLVLRLAGSHPVSIEDGDVVVRFELDEGERAYVTVGLADLPPADASLEWTRAYWQAWSGRIRYDGDYRDAVVRSALVLKLLTYSPTGAIIAAPTTSLPEAVPGNRNYDYRYHWVRDASFSITAFCGMGLRREAAEYLRFLRAADHSDGRELRLLYGIDGDVPEEADLPTLPGWNGVRPVRVGNAAREQQQFDIYGEYLLALHAYLEAVDFAPPPAIGDGLPALVANLAERAILARDTPDRGIWELRTTPEHLQHTKALLWVALVRAAKIAERMPGFSAESVARSNDAARALRAEYERCAWNPVEGAYMRAYGSDVLDAAVLRTVLFDALGAHDPRTRSTLAAIDRKLRVGDLVYRYRAPDGLDGDEGTFTACAFWRVGVLALGGDTRLARGTFERLLARGNDVGLFAEQIDPASGEQRGNFPQGFTHMVIVNGAVRLQRCIERFGLVGEGEGA